MPGNGMEKNVMAGDGIQQSVVAIKPRLTREQIAQHMRGEIELPMKVVRVVPDVDVRAIREGQDLTREQFAERYGLQVRAIQEWEQGRRKPEPAVRAYMLVIKNQPAAVRKALTAA